MRGVVRDVFGAGVAINPINEHGIRLLSKPLLFADGDSLVTEVNGEPLF